MPTPPEPVREGTTTFTVPGTPGFKSAGKIITIKGHASKALKPEDRLWYARVQEAFLALPADQQVLYDCPLRLLVVALYVCPNPYKPATVKRLGLRPARWKAVKPDGKNILAGTEDALEGLAFTNDSRIADTRCVKLYCAQGQPALTVVQLTALQPTDVELLL